MTTPHTDNPSNSSTFSTPLHLLNQQRPGRWYSRFPLVTLTFTVGVIISGLIYSFQRSVDKEIATKEFELEAQGPVDGIVRKIDAVMLDLQAYRNGRGQYPGSPPSAVSATR